MRHRRLGGICEHCGKEESHGTYWENLPPVLVVFGGYDMSEQSKPYTLCNECERAMAESPLYFSPLHLDTMNLVPAA